MIEPRRKVKRLRRSQALWLSARLWRRRLVFWLGAILVGLTSVGFARAALEAQHRFDQVLGISPWLAFVVTPAGFALSALLCRTLFPGAQGSGIPQAIAARKLTDPVRRNALLSLRLTIGKVLLTVLGIACGASIGREGPTVQVGASIMLLVARLGGIGRERGLILAGSAAGIAAAFNTPLAGIVFAIEEMSRAFEIRTSGLVLTAVILAGLAALGLLGNYSYFGHTEASLGDYRDWWAVAACGLGGGTMGAVFSRLVLSGTARVRRYLAGAKLVNAIALAAICGLAIAIIGTISGGATYGTGYEQARLAVEGGSLAWSFAPLKLLATLISSLSGIPGGIFAPSLAVGAGIGGVISQWVSADAAGAVVLLGMAGYFAGVVQAPITAFVIIIEMTQNHTMVIPLMVAAVLGYGISRLISPHPLYHALAEGFIHPPTKREAEPAPPP